MDPDNESEDERMLREREETLRNDRRKQAKWYEKLNLFAESLRVYESIDDQENIIRIKKKMMLNYSSKAAEMEGQGRYQEAANLYYLIGDHAGVGRMRKKNPNLLILYDNEGEGLKQLANSLDDITGGSDEDFFLKPNQDVSDTSKREETKTETVRGNKGIPVKMPKGRKKSFCPYCGEEINTRKEPLFCPFCGEKL